MGRLETRVVAPLRECTRGKSWRAFSGVGTGLGDKGDDVDEAKRRTTLARRRRKKTKTKTKTKTEKRRTPKCADCLRAAGATGGSTS